VDNRNGVHHGLAIPNGSLATGAQAIIWTCNGGPEQEWRVVDTA
jgi:hypothetical protein